MTTLTKAGPTVPVGPARTSHARPRKRNGLKWLQIGLFSAPALIVYIGFVFVPVVLAAYYSFFNWNGLGPLDRFIGFDNYTRALSDPVFIGAIKNNFFVLIMSLIVQGPLALGIALLLNRRIRGRAVIRLLIFIPYIISEVIAGLAFRLILQAPPKAGTYGAFDSVLNAIGLGDLRQLWLADPNFVMWTVFAVLTWKYLGFAILIMLAGLQGVPDELGEAAAIDGASWWQTQRHITIPLLGPTIRVWAFLSIIGSLQLFDMVSLLTPNGGPLQAAHTMATYMVKYGNNSQQIGFGSAVAVILFVISLIVALLYQRFALRRDLEGSLTGREE
jgi:raffinose/stachyose/melibiose transport system permease protein